MSAVRMNGADAHGFDTSSFECRLLPAGVVALVHDKAVMPLQRSARLARISDDSLSLSRLYAREPFEITVADQRWRWRWCYFDNPFIGLELRLRVGDAGATLGIQDLSVFGFAAADAVRPELPDELRATYLNALAQPLWPVLAGMLGRPVEITAARVHSTMSLASGCVGFEIGAYPNGAVTRGLLGALDANLQRLVCDVGDRKVRRSSLTMTVPLQWAAVVGTTQLTASELRTLETSDVVLIDDAVFRGELLECQLVIGVDRQRAGRVVLQLGELRLLQLDSPGAAFMTHPEIEPTDTQQSSFDEVPVMLRFELAQWQAPLAQLAQLQPGTVIDLGRRIDGQSIAMWAGQRCIGRGQLVAIGERLGVRVLSVGALEHADAQLASDDATRPDG